MEDCLEAYWFELRELWFRNSEGKTMYMLFPNSGGRKCFLVYDF